MTQDTRICFFGDSLVNGTCDETALGWPGRVCAAANREQQLTCYNLGIRRHTSRDILHYWQQECTRRLPDFCDGRVVFSFGVNDTMLENNQLWVEPEESVANLRAMLLAARQEYQVILAGPPPVSDEAHNARIQALSVRYAQTAASLGIAFIDLFSALAEDEVFRADVLQSDGYHPTRVGYVRMAAVVTESPDWWFPLPRLNVAPPTMER